MAKKSFGRSIAVALSALIIGNAVTTGAVYADTGRARDDAAYAEAQAREAKARAEKAEAEAREARARAEKAAAEAREQAAKSGKK